MDEKWILAMDGDGRVGGYSLCDIFAEAHGLKRLSGELPTQDFAVMRVLIAVLYAVYQKKGADGLQLSQIVKLYETLSFEHYNTDF